MTHEDKVPIKAVPLPLRSVRLTGGPLKKAQDLDAAYLLELQPERMLAFLRQRAGLAPDAQGYGGWDGPGRQLTGHIAGHYLSAISMMYATTGDVRFKQRADAFVAALPASVRVSAGPSRFIVRAPDVSTLTSALASTNRPPGRLRVAVT